MRILATPYCISRITTCIVFGWFYMKWILSYYSNWK